jgi:hypothetical protein
MPRCLALAGTCMGPQHPQTQRGPVDAQAGGNALVRLSGAAEWPAFAVLRGSTSGPVAGVARPEDVCNEEELPDTVEGVFGEAGARNRHFRSGRPVTGKVRAWSLFGSSSTTRRKSATHFVAASCASSGNARNGVVRRHGTARHGRRPRPGLRVVPTVLGPGFDTACFRLTRCCGRRPPPAPAQGFPVLRSRSVPSGSNRAGPCGRRLPRVLRWNGPGRPLSAGSASVRLDNKIEQEI